MLKGVWVFFVFLTVLVKAETIENEMAGVVNGSGGEEAKILPTAERFISAYSHSRLSSNFMLSLYQNLSRGIPLNRAIGRTHHWRNLKYVDTVRTFPAIGSFENRQMLLYKFNLSQIGNSEVVRAAELHFWLPATWNNNNNVYVVAMASSESAGAIKNGLMYASPIPIITPSFSNEGLAIIDATLPVKDWLSGFGGNERRRILNEFTLDVAVVIVRRKVTLRSKLLKSLENIYETVIIDDKEMNDVILVTYSEAGTEYLNTTSHNNKNRNGRQKRTSEDSASNASDLNALSKDASACRRKDMIVDFPALGWGEWVVYPTLFNAFQCTGKCGGFTDSRHNPTNHAVIQNLIRQVFRNDIPYSCCAPSKLAPLSILYLEKGSVVIKHHEDLIVEECRCM